MKFAFEEVEMNGKTVRENNLRIPHKYPLYSIVEVNCEGCDTHGRRMYVQGHKRDCDGTPIYNLTGRYDAVGIDFNTETRPASVMSEAVWKLRKDSVDGPYGEDSLIFVEDGTGKYVNLY